MSNLTNNGDFETMAYLSVTNGANGAIFGFDTNNPDNITINTSKEQLAVIIDVLSSATEVADRMATAFGVSTTPASSGSTSSATTSTTSSATTSSVSSGGSATVTSGGSAT